MSSPSYKTNPNEGNDKPISKSVVSGLPECCVGGVFCQHPKPADQFMTTECDHCMKDCHDCCGQLLDVPDKLFETQPGFYCNRCVQRLPRYLYPKMPQDGIAQNIPKEYNNGYGFPLFLKKQNDLWTKKTKRAQKKKTPMKRKKPVTMKKKSTRARRKC